MTAPISRSPSMRFSPPSPPRSSTPPLVEDEDIPAPYAYTAIMVPDTDREALKEKFMEQCNQKRWHHIFHANPPVKVPK